jgi:hypothetical protein
MSDIKTINFTGIDIYRQGVQAMIDRKYAKALEYFDEFLKLKDSTNEHYIKLADSYMENLGTIIITLRMIKEDTNKDQIYQQMTSKC